MCADAIATQAPFGAKSVEKVVTERAKTAAKSV
jgi:hypothetical protein